MYRYDSKGKVIGRRDWPDDLKVTLNYTDKNGASKQLTLVEERKAEKATNYGSLELTGGSREEPLLAAVTITAAASAPAVPPRLSPHRKASSAMVPYRPASICWVRLVLVS
ncbi:MAG: hypothetical protein ACLR0U_16705 [Enterocloster clostridioformis]